MNVRTWFVLKIFSFSIHMYLIADFILNVGQLMQDRGDVEEMMKKIASQQYLLLHTFFNT